MTDFRKRRARAAMLAREAGLSALAIVPGPNFRYLTGLELHQMEHPTLLLLTAEGRVLAIMPELERSRRRTAFPRARTVFLQDSEGLAEPFRKLSVALAGPVGVEGLRMRMSEFEALAAHLPPDEIVNADSILARLRICKESDEIAALRQAIENSEAALDELLETAQAGDSEVEIVAQRKQAMLARGAEGFAFDPIVLSGRRSADPHGTPGRRTVAPGEPLLVDFGASWGGMNADITRTLFCEHAPEHACSIHETALAANVRGREVAGPGVACDVVDREATAVLSASPFADMVRRRTGHGLRLDVHEAPHVTAGNGMRPGAGMVVAIEPGLCGPGERGIRIEDNVPSTEDGAESLTRFPCEVRHLG
ncbi:MAG: aminopeptidase P family protein [Boseongicola sp. SB0664_bin_43]|uniref:Aminopeptidase P family protein n=1 Tax=Boseongicola sp. SB0664_bin_43 TaxID=2604844 RepID=A0A6B0Y050_9RHOB|nr:aminopeptidase P family protein [Boseongicola sp. SB0664_bin_43]MYK30330.1 aminopeptidase P family protein [Boseongicola sp. SB0670_bin_30]